MRAFYEELWARLPAELDPPAFAARRAFLLAHVRPGERVLDLGCGEGHCAAAAAEAGAEVVGIDVAQAALERAHAAYPALELRLAPEDGPLPLEDSSVDLVWASEVLEHVADTARLLSEARRVLRSGGALLVTTPARGRGRLLLSGPPDPLGDELHLYTRRSLAATLAGFGFEEVRVGRLGGATLTAVARRAEWRSGR